jgi:diguanylate cyclase (GGDEF)-like protein/PAS domain S-box-containing protein
LFKLARTDLDKAKQFYITEYIPAHGQGINLSEAALTLATQDVLDLQMEVEDHAHYAQSVARIAIILFVLLGVGSGFFLTRAVRGIVHQWEHAAHINRNMLEYSLDVICSVDKAGRFIEVSSACQEVWGYSPEELRGRPVRDLLHSDDVEKTTDVATAIAMGIYVKDFENRCLCKDGSVVDMLWSAHWSDVEQSMFCVARDMTERKEVQEQLRTLAMFDGLTGLLNRTAIMECLFSEMERAKRGNLPLSVVLLDLDHFKQVNDVHGHAAGDAVLKEAAQRMKSSLRIYDQVGRYGGEEFLIVAPGCGKPGILSLAERVRHSIDSDSIPTRQGALDMSCSLGAACAAANEGTDALIARADAALYRAKANGRNRTELASECTASSV